MMELAARLATSAAGLLICAFKLAVPCTLVADSHEGCGRSAVYQGPSHHLRCGLHMYTRVGSSLFTDLLWRCHGMAWFWLCLFPLFAAHLLAVVDEHMGAFHASGDDVR